MSAENMLSEGLKSESEIVPEDMSQQAAEHLSTVLSHSSNAPQSPARTASPVLSSQHSTPIASIASSTNSSPVLSPVPRKTKPSKNVKLPVLDKMDHETWLIVYERAATRLELTETNAFDFVDIDLFLFISPRKPNTYNVMIWSDILSRVNRRVSPTLLSRTYYLSYMCLCFV